MPEGPGKYDSACTMARMLTNGQAVVLVVLNGVRGSGFSVQASEPVPPAVLADLLESVVGELRKLTEP